MISLFLVYCLTSYENCSKQFNDFLSYIQVSRYSKFISKSKKAKRLLANESALEFSGLKIEVYMEVIQK